MLVRGKGAIIEGAEGKSPPLPFITVSEDEGLALIGTGVAVQVSDDAEAPADVSDVTLAAFDGTVQSVGDTTVFGPTPTEPEPEIVEDVVQEPAEETPAATPEPEPELPTEPEVITDRNADLAEAFEILGEDDLVKTGARAGRPKITSLEAATGFKDLTVNEVDVLWLAREGAA
jgi:hypothetical protein